MIIETIINIILLDRLASPKVDIAGSTSAVVKVIFLLAQVVTHLNHMYYQYSLSSCNAKTTYMFLCSSFPAANSFPKYKRLFVEYSMN